MPRGAAPAGRPGRRAREQNAFRASSPPRSANVSPPRCSASRPGLLQGLALQLPEDLGGEPAVAHQRQAEGVLGLDPGQAGRRVEHGGQAVALGQLARLGGDAAGDRLELVAAGQVVLDDDELLLQLDGDLHDRGQDDDEGPVLLAGGDPGVEGLDDLGRAEEPVEVAEHQDGGAVGRGQGGQASGSRPAGRRRRRRRRSVGSAGEGQAAVDVPGGQGPALVAAEAGDLGDGVVVLVRCGPRGR